MSDRIALAVRLRPALLSFTVQLTGGNVADAEDIVQDTYVRALCALDRADERVDAEQGMRSLLWTIAQNLWIDAYRKRMRNKQVPLIDADEVTIGEQMSGNAKAIPKGITVEETPEDIVVRWETEMELYAAIETELTPPVRDFVTQSLSGVSQTEYADSVGLSRGAIRFRAWSARQRLKPALSALR